MQETEVFFKNKMDKYISHFSADSFSRLDNGDDRRFYQRDRCMPTPVPSSKALGEGITAE